jgi:hypothetical protein
VPFVRFSRDKRGYENFFLIDSDARGQGGMEKHRILYWFRTPPNVKVGRKPFDDPATRELEARNPGMTFDWEKLRNTPIPPVQPDHWRERRRAERAARQAEPGIQEPSEQVAGETPRQSLAGETIEGLAASQAVEPSREPAQPAAGSEVARRRRRRRRRMGGVEQQTERRAEPSITSDLPIGPSGDNGDEDEDDQEAEQ